jgi:hypothetical protein
VPRRSHPSGPSEAPGLSAAPLFHGALGIAITHRVPFLRRRRHHHHCHLPGGHVRQCPTLLWCDCDCSNVACGSEGWCGPEVGSSGSVRGGTSERAGSSCEFDLAAQQPPRTGARRRQPFGIMERNDASCTHTNKQVSPWWRVDLLQPTSVHSGVQCLY